MSHHHGPQEPPIPHPEHYELSYAAARQTRFRRAVRWADHHPGTVVAALVVLIACVPVYVVLQDNVATAAGDHAAVVGKPTAGRGPEYAPPVADRVTGDGMWLVGKQIQPGVYQSNAGASCYWERLAGLSGSYADLIDNGGFRRGPKLVEVRSSDFAFSSQRCGEWVKVR